MDAESLAQIQQIVTNAVTGTEDRLRTEIAVAVSGTEDRLRTEIAATASGTEDRLRTEIAAAASHTEDGLRSEMQGIREEFGEKIEAAERHAGALFEETLHRIDLIVEGHQSLRAQISGLDQKIDHVSVELQSLIKLSYRELHDHVETPEQRVTLIEKRLRLTN